MSPANSEEIEAWERTFGPVDTHQKKHLLTGLGEACERCIKMGDGEEHEPRNVGDRAPYRAAGMFMSAVVAAVPFGM